MLDTLCVHLGWISNHVTAQMVDLNSGTVVLFFVGPMA